MRDHPALAAAAWRGLPLAPHSPVIIGAADGAHVIAAARHDGITGFLAAAIEAGDVAADAVTTAAVGEVWRGAMTGAVVVERLVVRTAAIFDAAGVRWRLTKGAAVAHLDYPAQVALRTFGDVDVMIHPGDWSAALAALERTGHRRPAPELRPRFDVRYGKGATIVDGDDLEIDLNLRFAIGRFGVLAQSAELFGRAESIELAGRRLPTLAAPDRLLHACHHAVLGGFSGLRVARDVAQLLLVTDVDWEATVETAQRWRVAAVVAVAVIQAWDKLSLDVEHAAHDWARRHVADRRDAQAIDVFCRQRPFREQALTALPALPWRRIPGYLLALGLPSAQARRARSRTLHAQLTSRTAKLLHRPR